MKIDLHCHTKATKQGEGKGRNVSNELFTKKVAEADIKIVAITNHNVFDEKQYKELKEAVHDYCEVWPGIELDMQGETKYHLIIIANPNNASQFSKAVSNLNKKRTKPHSSLSFSDVYNAFNSYDILYIPHYHDKCPWISKNDFDEIFDKVKESWRIFGELQNSKSLGVYTYHGENVLVGSDVKDWNNYEASKFVELKLPVKTFEQFCLLSKKDTDTIKTLLNKKKSVNLLSHPHKSVDLYLDVYPDINIIFGQKGTGKTEIVKSMHKDMESKDFKCSIYSGTQKEAEFDELLQIDDMKNFTKTYLTDDCCKEFAYIKDYFDEVPTVFDNYKIWWKTKDNSKNKKLLKITEASTKLWFYNKEESNIKVDYENIAKVVSLLSNIKIDKYLQETESSTFKNLLNTLNVNIRKNFINCILEKNAEKLCDFTIDKIKSIADNKTDTKSKPSSTGFKEFALNRISLFHNIGKVIRVLNLGSKINRYKIGYLDDKGSIYIREQYRMLCKDSVTEEFSTGINKLRTAKKCIDKVQKNVFEKELNTSIAEFKKSYLEDNIVSASYFVGCSKNIVDEKNDCYEPSNGEKGMLLLQRKLDDESCDAYFLDEPELGMGNSYINGTIIPILINYAKNNKFVVVATHNANIAVRSLPFMTIYRTHDNAVYNTYTGNPFENILVNQNSKEDTKSWIEESLNILEGGEEAFYERKFVYESDKKSKTNG